jgi:hypothetical protein
MYEAGVSLREKDNFQSRTKFVDQVTDLLAVQEELRSLKLVVTLSTDFKKESNYL